MIYLLLKRWIHHTCSRQNYNSPVSDSLRPNLSNKATKMVPNEFCIPTTNSWMKNEARQTTQDQSVSVFLSVTFTSKDFILIFRILSFLRYGGIFVLVAGSFGGFLVRVNGSNRTTQAFFLLWKPTLKIVEKGIFNACLTGKAERTGLVKPVKSKSYVHKAYKIVTSRRATVLLFHQQNYRGRLLK